MFGVGCDLDGEVLEFYGENISSGELDHHQIHTLGLKESSNLIAVLLRN